MSRIQLYGQRAMGRYCICLKRGGPIPARLSLLSAGLLGTDPAATLKEGKFAWVLH